MPVETAIYIHDLVPTNPLHTDGLNQADSHMRLIKQVLQNTFPNATGPITASANDLNGFVPVGGIIMWSGTLASIPSNFKMCNGLNGTPNLVDRFIPAAGNVYGVGSAGGATYTSSDGGHTHPGSLTDFQGAHDHAVSSTGTGAGTTDVQGSHNHGGTQSHTLTLSEIPAHEHLSGVSVITSTNTGVGGFQLNPSGSTTLFNQSDSFQGGGAGHSHGLNFDAAHGHNVSTTVAVSGTTDVTGSHQHNINLTTDGTHFHNFTPEYYALYYIMRTV